MVKRKYYTIKKIELAAGSKVTGSFKNNTFFIIFCHSYNKKCMTVEVR